MIPGTGEVVLFHPGTHIIAMPILNISKLRIGGRSSCFMVRTCNGLEFDTFISLELCLGNFSSQYPGSGRNLMQNLMQNWSEEQQRLYQAGHWQKKSPES